MKKIILSMVFALGMANVSFAQEAVAIEEKPLQEHDRNTAVTIEHEGYDTLGAQLTMKIKEGLNTSSLFTLNEEDKPKFRILLSTVPEFDDRPKVGSAYSVIWVFSQNEAILRHYIASEIGVFSEENIDALTTKILQKTDDYAVRYGYLFQEN